MNQTTTWTQVTAALLLAPLMAALLIIDQTLPLP
jgi:hypothetical protein